MKPYFKKNYCPNLFTWKEFEYLLNIRPLMTNRRVRILSPVSYKWDNAASSLDKNCYPPSLLQDLLEKYNCYFIDMSRATEKINNFSRDIDNTFKKQCDAHVYMCRNPNLNHPFGVHYDLVPNIIIQCEGQTRFKVWDKEKKTTLEKYYGVVVTEVVQRKLRKSCNIFVVTGRHRQKWQHLISVLEDFALEQECNNMELIASKGWERIMEQFNY